MSNFTLPILSDWKSTLVRWATELRTPPSENQEWKTWDPMLEYDPVGMSNVATVVARYAIVNKTCHFHIYISAFTTAAPSNYFRVKMPVESAPLSLAGIVGYYSGNGVGRYFPATLTTLGQGQWYLSKMDTTNFNASAHIELFFTSFYEIS